MVERARRVGPTGFELWLVPSSDDSNRHSILSAGRISRSSALRTLRTFNLSPALLSALPERLLAREDLGRAGRSGAVARIEVVRLTPRQTLHMFGAVRGTDSSVRELYAHLQEKGFVLLPERARGTVMRTYSADGLPGSGGAVIELPHEGPDGALAWFHVSAREGTEDDRDRVADAVSADYSIRRGPRVEIRSAGGERGAEEPRALSPERCTLRSVGGRSQTPGR